VIHDYIYYQIVLPLFGNALWVLGVGVLAVLFTLFNRKG